MKLTEVLQKIFNKEAFPDNDVETVFSASALKDIEFPDAAFSKFNQVYLTRDRAENDTELVKKLTTKNWGFFLDDFDKRLKKIADILPDEWQTRYFAIPKNESNSTYDRLLLLGDAISHLKDKGANEDVKTASEKFRKLEKELRAQLQAEQDEKKKIQEDFSAKEQGIKMNYALRSKLTGYLPKLDPALVKTDVHKNFIIDSTISSLQNEFLLEFDKDNQSAINFMKKDRTDVYDGNTKVTLDKWIEKQLEPYVVKNGGGEVNTDSKNESRKKVEMNGQGQSLHEKRWAQTAV